MKWPMLLSMLVLPIFLFAQLDTPADQSDSHILFLHKKVKSIEKIEFKDDDEELKGKLGSDEESVILDNYQKGKRVLVTVINLDGTRETIERSPCTIFKNIGV
jgi:hypothetical protein